MKSTPPKTFLLSLMFALSLAHVSDHHLYAGTQAAISITSYATPKTALLLALLTAGAKAAANSAIEQRETPQDSVDLFFLTVTVPFGIITLWVATLILRNV